MNRLEPDRKLLRRRLSRLGPALLHKLLLLQEADMGSKGTGLSSDSSHFDEIRRLLAEIQAENACLSLKDLAINGTDLISLGFKPGKAIGVCLERLLERVLDEQLPNDRSALLAEAKKHLSQEDLL